MRSATRVPEGKGAEQVAGHSIPAGSLVTLADEPGSILTFSVCGPGCGEPWPNAPAISVFRLSVRSMHAPAPAAAQAPSPQASKRPPALGTGVSVVVEPYRTPSPHTMPAAPPQLRPERLVTVPGPPTESRSPAQAPMNLARTDTARSSAISQIRATPMHPPSQR